MITMFFQNNQQECYNNMLISGNGIPFDPIIALPEVILI
jgi:hypothetical protein